MSNAKLLQICNKEIKLIEKQLEQNEKSPVLDKSSLHYVGLWQRLRDLHEVREIYEEMK